MEDATVETLRKKKNLVGIKVFLVLAILTAIEFIIAISGANLNALLVLVALAKASLIMVYFMHIGRLFLDREE